MEELEIPVPEAVCAGYRVPLPALMEEPEVRRGARKAVQARLSEPLRALVVKWIDDGSVLIDIEPEQPPEAGQPPEPEQPPEGEPGVAIARFTAASRPTLLALQEWKARGAAAAFAANLDAPVLDLWEQRTMTADEALRTLPDTKMTGCRAVRGDPLVTIGVPFTSWVHVHGALSQGQAWMFTEGMRRFGLPEMRIGGASPKLREELTAILIGVAFKLYCYLIQRELEDGSPGAAQLSPPLVIRVPAEIDISRAEVDKACDVPNRGGGCTSVGLRFHARTGEDERDWLTVWPPSDWTLSMEDFIADICHALFAFEKPRWYYIPEFGALIEGIVSAKVHAPELRDRFLRRDIPDDGRLLVRHRKPDKVEFVWARVESWDDAEQLVVRDIGRELTPGVRPDPPMPVETSLIIDWAVWVDGKGVVEGAETEGRGRSLV